MVNFQRKERYDWEDLLTIMRILRAPGGCPWDREQTHQSIRRNFLEETYEALDAIDRDSAPDMQEELGDVLLQVVFHAAMEEERGRFTPDDVVDGVAQKLVFRHAHVFGSAQAAADSAEALEELLAWMDAHGCDRLKAATRIMITPLGYEFRIVRNIVTNFHQPKSTLLLLVSAFVGEEWRNIYDYALDHGFRFLSYGDSSVLLRE